MSTSREKSVRSCPSERLWQFPHVFSESLVPSFLSLHPQMAYGATKILKPGGEKLDKFEESVSQVSLTQTVNHKLMHVCMLRGLWIQVLRSVANDQCMKWMSEPYTLQSRCSLSATFLCLCMECRYVYECVCMTGASCAHCRLC